MVVKENRGRQIALKELIDSKVKSKPFAYSLQLIALMIFCVLFSGLLVSPVFGQEAKGLSKVNAQLGKYNYKLYDAVTNKPIISEREQVLMAIRDKGVQVRRRNNMISFCPEDTGIRPEEIKSRLAISPKKR